MLVNDILEVVPDQGILLTHTVFPDPPPPIASFSLILILKLQECRDCTDLLTSFAHCLGYYMMNNFKNLI